MISGCFRGCRAAVLSSSGEAYTRFPEAEKMSESPDRYEFRDHTADILLWVEAGDRAGLMTQAARGLYAAIGELAPGTRAVETRISLEAQDAELLLHDWLAELLYRLEVRAEWLTEFDFARCDSTNLDASARGTVIDLDASQIDREVKAVTLHDLESKETDGKLHGEVVLDI